MVNVVGLVGPLETTSQSLVCRYKKFAPSSIANLIRHCYTSSYYLLSQG